MLICMLYYSTTAKQAPRNANIIFMEDGAPPHILRAVNKLLANVFQDRVLRNISQIYSH